jgi:hypothetical protein
MSEYTPAAGILHDTYPPQGKYLDQRVKVCFDYDTRYQFDGTVIRDDTAMPGTMIIQLDDNRVVKSTECQWRPAPTGEPTP